MNARNKHHANLFQRYENNPILTANDWHYPVNTVFNPGATRLKDGSTLLLCRAEDFRGHSHLTAARSANGIDNWQVDKLPTMLPDIKNNPEELWGIEDPRITYVPELDQYMIAYTSYAPGGPGVSLASTTDFHTFKRYGVVMSPEDKDAAFFPRQINGQWVLIHRPVSGTAANMWISYSNDLQNWGSHKMILEARRGAWWDANKIGLSPPPIETKEGWLIIYHGVRQTPSGCIYRLGLALMDLEDPARCIRRGNTWMFGPETSYEQHGDVNNVVFPCGFTIGDDGDSLNIYYGAADNSIALATASINTLLAWLKEDSEHADFSINPVLKTSIS